ncbi:MAG: helix-turn-helix transcriptional regulator [Clostridia bacterium]|nr:helix-turn-helix transcriptional regulator [Clostridia bacterium]
MYIDEVPLRIARLRNAKGVSARDMSLSIGQNENYINQIENGKSLPSLDAFFNICECFNITLPEFFGAESKNPVRLRALIEDLKRLDDDELQAVNTLVRGLLQK